jgi:hypothetical protein
MDQNNQENMLINAAKVAVPVIFLAPIAIPILQGLAGIAVAGLGLFGAGTIVSKTVNVFSSSSTAQKREDDSSSN